MLIKIGSALVDPAEIVSIKPYPNEYLKIDIILRNSISLLTDASMDEAEAALIDAGVMTDLTADLESDETSMSLLTDWEAEKLHELESDGYRYLARDKDGKLYAFWHKPKYGGFYWDDPDRSPALQIDGFLFITEEDEEPVEISQLLESLS